MIEGLAKIDLGRFLRQAGPQQIHKPLAAMEAGAQRAFRRQVDQERLHAIGAEFAKRPFV